MVPGPAAVLPMRVPRGQRAPCASSLLLAAAAVFCLCGSSPSAFFTVPAASPAAGEQPAGEAAAAAPLDGASKTGPRLKNFFEGPKFLKVLVGMEELDPLREMSARRAVEDATGSQVRMPIKGEWYPFKTGKPKRELSFSGETEAVLNAFREVNRGQLDEKAQAFFVVPNDANGALIGTGGEKITMMRDKTAAEVIVFEASNAESIVSVRGTTQAVQSVAEWLLQEQDAYADAAKNILASSTYRHTGKLVLESCEIFIMLTDSQKARVIGKQGSTLKRFVKDFHVRLQFDEDNRGPNGEYPMKISGYTGDVHQAHQTIVQLIFYDKGLGSPPAES